MQRLRQTIVLTLVLAVPAAAQTYYFKPPKPCFTHGSATYRLTTDAAANHRVKFDRGAAHPHLRIRLVDQPETADFVLADDFAARDVSACPSSLPVQTIAIDNTAQAADIVIGVAPDADDADFGIYVHSARFSAEDAAALFAVIWKASQPRAMIAQR
jgi:hypothetical protein